MEKEPKDNKAKVELKDMSDISLEQYRLFLETELMKVLDEYRKRGMD